MSPKKRNRRKPQQGSDQQGPDQQPDNPDQGRVDPGHTPEKRPISRTPVTVQGPPDRRITVLWVILWSLWALGSPLALAALLFAGLDAFEATADPALADPAQAADIAEQAVRTIGNALIWLLILAWGVPAIGAVTALILRRKMAAIAFSVALALSVGLLLLAMPPADLWGALTTHLLG